MENKGAITPQMVTQITQLSPDEISEVSKNVMDATRYGNQAIDELTHLSQCLSDFVETQERYQKVSKHVKNQMRYVGNHL